MSFYMLAAGYSSESNDAKKSWYCYKQKQTIHLGLSKNIQSIMKQRLSYFSIPHPRFNFGFIVCCIFRYLLRFLNSHANLNISCKTNSYCRENPEYS